MLNSICDEKGITLLEVLLSVVLIAVGVMGLLTLMPSGWRLSGTSDALGRAAGILQAELERQEVFVINPNSVVAAIPAGDPQGQKVVYAGGAVAQAGDNIPYTVETVRTALAAPSSGWRVKVKVTWPTNANGIEESLIVRPLVYFRM